jgi:hypothetical protein
VNLYFLVEGNKTEKIVYRSWIAHVFPNLRQVHTLEQIDTDCFLIVAGKGYPAAKQRILNALADIQLHGRIEHFFICVDAEEENAQDRFTEIVKVISQAPSSPAACHIVIHNCCIESWFLGNQKIWKRNPTSIRLWEFQQFYDVKRLDPELMGCPTEYLIKAQFHYAYLQELLSERNIKYTKAFPRHVADKTYLAQLVDRHQKTGHLQSFGNLLTIWRSLGGKL